MVLSQNIKNTVDHTFAMRQYYKDGRNDVVLVNNIKIRKLKFVESKIIKRNWSVFTVVIPGTIQRKPMRKKYSRGIVEANDSVKVPPYTRKQTNFMSL